MLVVITVIAISTVIVITVMSVLDVIHDVRTWHEVRDALRVALTPGDKVIAKAPSYLTDAGKEVECRLLIRQESDGLKRYLYRLDVGDMESFEFSHGEVNDSTDGDVVQYLKDHVYHGRWIVQ